METLSCSSTCTGVTITIDGYQYCRDASIWVDPTATERIELGSLAYPYKTIDQAFIEIFNYWSATNPVTVKVLEGTTNKIYFQERPLIANRKDNIEITTYSTGGSTAAMATLNVLNTELYAKAWNTAYSLMQGKDYDYTTGLGASVTTSEKSTVNSLWYTFIILQCDFKMDGFIVNNNLKLEDDDFAIVNPTTNLASKTLTINNCIFEIYGTVMAAFTSTSFRSLNVTIDTKNLVGGFVFLVSCTPGTDVTTGDVVIDGLKLDGLRVVLFKYGAIYMTGPQNFTITNSYIGSYGFMFDAKQLTRADSPLNCQPTDGVKQIVTVQNTVYNMSFAYTGTPHHGFICSFLEWYPRTNMEVYFVNNTMINVQRTFYRIMLLDVNYAKVYVTDNLFSNSTSSVDIAQITTTKAVEVLRNTFQNISSTSQNVLVISSAPSIVVTNFTMNGANPEAVSSAVLNLNMASGAVATLTNIWFFDNSFLGTKAIVSQQLLTSFVLTNSSFLRDTLMQNTNYIDIQKANYISITDTIFKDIEYQNDDDSGTYLIYIAKKESITGGVNSIIEDISFNNIKTNAISFGGFSDTNTGGVGDLIIQNVSFMNSTFNSPDSLITSKKYSYSGSSKIIIQNTNFTDLNFVKFGNLIELTHNAFQPVQLKNVDFINVYGAGIYLEPQDIFDTDNPLTLAISSCTFTDNTPWVSGFINVFENSIVTVDASTFVNMYSVGSGSVILANYKENTITINDSTFTNNYAILGGVFYSQFSSQITCNNCTFTNNVAIRGGLAFLNSNGKITLNNCTVTQNQALNAPILYISACQADYSVISNSKVFSNTIITMTQLLAKNATGLSHIKSDYIASVLENQEFYEKSVSGSKKSGISMIKGKVRINEGTVIYNQDDFLATFESEIEIIDSTIRDITLDSSHIIFHLLSSTFTYENSIMQNIDCPSKDEAIFQVRLESTFTVSGSSSLIKNTTCQFSFLLYSFAYLNDITFDTASLGQAYLDSIESTLQMNNTILKNINTTSEAVILIENSAELTTFGAQFLSSNTNYFYVTGSTLTFENSIFDNQLNVNMRAVVFEESTINLKGSTFKNLHFTEAGGAVDTLNCQVTVDGSTFKNNSAPYAGGIALRCEEGTKCDYTIKNSMFEANHADTNGGAIYYDYYKPTFTNNTYTNNSAAYGPNIAAYPIKIEVFDIPAQDYVSGQEIKKEIKYKLVDPDGLTIATDSDSVITIAPVSSNDRVIGNTDVTVENGVAIFSDITFISSPGAKNISYLISSSNIDETKLKDAFNLTLANTTQTMTISFRKCIIGEEQTNDMCITCPTGKYSLELVSSECNICPKHASCLGGAEIRVEKGYWRSSFLSDDIHECLNSNACLEDDGESEEYPYKCRKGYSNNLCQKCVKLDGDQYQRTGDNGCGICPNAVLNFFRLFGIFILLIILVILVIWSNIRTLKDSPQSILIRIMTNYFQIITSAASFNLSFPSSLEGFFSGVKTVGETAKIFLSVDCFIQDFAMVNDNSTTEYFKAFMTGLSPFIFVAIVIVVWFCIRIFKKYEYKDLKNRMIISIVVVLWLLHPSITGMSMGLFNCYEIDAGEYWLFKDLSIRCWRGAHPAYAFGLSLPMILFWVFGLPFVGFLIVRRNKKHLDDETVSF